MTRKLSAILICALAAPLLAVSTAHWVATNETDFKKGKFHNTVATNLGDVKLSRAVKTLLEQDPRISTVYALAQRADGVIYAGTGPHGIVLRVKDDKISTALVLEDESVFSLAIDDQQRLLIGTGGEKGRLLRLEKDSEKPTEIFTADGVQYIWQIRQTPDGMIYLGTGPSGRIYQIAPDGGKSVLLDTTENNILSLVSDGKDMLYAGTDPNGLVYRINRKTKESFVLFDAPESEISALALDAKGTLYAGTAQTSDSDQSEPEPVATGEAAGRPDSGETTTPLPAPRPKEPKPPETPNPDPANPNPIPKQELKLSMLAGDTDRPSTREAGPVPGPTLPPGSGGGPQPQRSRSGAGRAMPPGSANQPPVGNAVYRIDPSGYVTEVFRQGGMVLSLLEKNGILLVGTGSDGLIYQVNPAAEETLALAKVDPKQVMCMLPANDGRIIMGLANVGGLAAMSSGYASQGTYTSPVLDGVQVNRFGKIHLLGALPPGSVLTVATRSGNQRLANDKGWSPWSAEVPATEYIPVSSPSARFLQYRLTFNSQDGVATPVVDHVDVAHLPPNLTPQIKSIKVTPIAEPEPRPAMPPQAMPMPNNPPKEPLAGRMRLVTWEANTADNDTLVYALYFRSASRAPWILLQDKLKDPMYQWDTRQTADGQYQLKVVASDAKANPPGQGRTGMRISQTVVVDNTPPVIGDVKITKLDKGQIRLQAKIVDRTSIVASAEYSVDAKDDWQALAPSDNMFDSPEEGVVFTIDNLAAGAHQIMLRASDDHGNQAYETIQVLIDAPPGK